MSLEQQVTALVASANALTGAVNGKVGQIDQRMNNAETQFNVFKLDADSRYLNVVKATTAGHKLMNINFGDWELMVDEISPTRGANALILSKQIPLSIDPAVRGDMCMIGVVHAMRIHTSKGIQQHRFLVNHAESYTSRISQVLPDQFAMSADWEIRSVLLPALDPSVPFLVLSRTYSLDTSPGTTAFLGNLTLNGIWGTSDAYKTGQYEHSGRAVILSDVGYVKPGA